MKKPFVATAPIHGVGPGIGVEMCRAFTFLMSPDARMFLVRTLEMTEVIVCHRNMGLHAGICWKKSQNPRYSTWVGARSYR